MSIPYGWVGVHSHRFEEAGEWGLERSAGAGSLSAMWLLSGG
ncbi:MAG: hypothetical protein PHS75_04665 [Anaerolineaceae bacterium]|nr:hypothetical protein [Anaerolineaceae bacterium]